MNKKNGISLMVLIITIIIMTTLASTVFVLLLDSDLFDSTKSVLAEWQVKDIKERIEDTYALMVSESVGSPREITVNDVINRLVDEGVPLDVLGEVYFDIIDTNVVIGALENAPTYRNKETNIFNK